MALTLSCSPLQWTPVPSIQLGVRKRRVRYGGGLGMGSCSRLRMVAQALESNGGGEADKLVAGYGGDSPARRPTFNSMINTSSKWAVMALVVGVGLWRHDPPSAWILVGSIVNGGISKTLKYLIDENRPPTADGVKEDPGMPSSHAQGFCFLGTFAALALLLSQGMKVWTVLGASGILLSTVYLSWLRVIEGLHTAPQVLVGGTLGSSIAVFWLWTWKSGVGAAIESSHALKICLLLSLCCITIPAAVIVVKEW